MTNSPAEATSWLNDAGWNSSAPDLDAVLADLSGWPSAIGLLADAVEDACGGAYVHVEGDAVVGVAGHLGDVGRSWRSATACASGWGRSGRGGWCRRPARRGRSRHGRAASLAARG